MPQEYKIFYDDRVIVLTGKITKTFEKNEGLFYKYQKKDELLEIVEAFGHFSQVSALYVLHTDVDELLDIVKSGFTIVEAAGGLVRDPDGRLLAIFRRGKWDLPKGKVEKGEFYQQTALREVKEECGLDQIDLGKKLSDTYHVYFDNGKSVLKRTIWYEMFVIGNVQLIPQTEEDITDVRWFDYQTVSEVMRNTYESLKEPIISVITPEK